MEKYFLELQRVIFIILYSFLVNGKAVTLYEVREIVKVSRVGS